MAQAEKKKNSAGIWIVIIVIVLILLFVLWSKKGTAQNLPTNTITPPNNSTTTPTTTYVTITDQTLLKKGMNNSHVAKLQKLINQTNLAYGLPAISEDGVFGSGTEAALKKLTGKTEISYAHAYQLSTQKLQEKGYSQSWWETILGITPVSN